MTWHHISVKCPRKKCDGYAEAPVTAGEGNTQAPCDECLRGIAFHYTIEVEDIHVVSDEEE